MRIEGDQWLSGVYGRPAFRVTLDESAPTSEECRRSVETAAAGAAAFFYARIPTHRADQVRSLTHAGFDVVDVAVTLDRTPARNRKESTSHGSNEGGVVVREALPGDHTATLDIAETCFVYSRFHLDAQVPRAIANRIKREWIDSYCHGRRGERLLVAEVDGNIAGFLAVLAATVSGRRASVIDLVGVSLRFQRRGVGERLVNHFIDCHSGAEMLRVGTQAANIPSLRLYHKCGFAVAETAYVLHGHTNAPD